ncbi:MAG TPA: polyphosphate polymerase domain-containing protein [Nocardioides sp.]|nr:polyphosphate polymerase domain-containing protein [Nocardioides sp.]
MTGVRLAPELPADVLDSLVAPLPPIGLDELVAVASLLTRVDRKYVVSVADLPRVLGAVPDSTRVLEIAGRRAFGYRSTYLDTPGLRSYFDAGRRRRRRFKVRTRRYLDSDTSWLEVKTRAGRDVTVKNRIAHPEVSEDAGLTAEGLAFVDAELAAGRIRHVRAVSLAPALTTSYDRATLYLPESASRATIDVGLGWTTSDALGGRDLERPGLAIVETKTGSTPSALDHVLWGCGHRPVCTSKFGAGMAALVPGLPDLKWHRTLRRDLAVARPRPDLTQE